MVTPRRKGRGWKQTLGTTLPGVLVGIVVTFLTVLLGVLVRGAAFLFWLDHHLRAAGRAAFECIRASLRRRRARREAMAEQSRALWQCAARLDEIAFNTELLCSQLWSVAIHTELLFERESSPESESTPRESSLSPARSTLPPSHLAAIAEVKGHDLPKPPPVPREMRSSRRPRSGIIRRSPERRLVGTDDEG